NNCSCLFQALAATVVPMTLLKSLTSVPGPGGECFPWYMLLWRSHNFMSVPDLGGEVMSCLTTNNCSCLFQALAATVDPMTLLKSLTSVPGPGVKSRGSEYAIKEGESTRILGHLMRVPHHIISLLSE
ncbi:hypothetical protein C1646_729268, partial [Rhizophagus diaphanus]